MGQGCPPAARGPYVAVAGSVRAQHQLAVWAEFEGHGEQDASAEAVPRVRSEDGQPPPAGHVPDHEHFLGIERQRELAVRAERPF